MAISNNYQVQQFLLKQKDSSVSWFNNKTALKDNILELFTEDKATIGDGLKDIQNPFFAYYKAPITNQAPILLASTGAVDVSSLLKKKEVKNYVPDFKKVKLVETKSTVENLEKLSKSYRLSENVLLVGHTGVGKTSLVKYLASITKNDLRRINLSDMTDVTELVGGYKPDSSGTFKWQNGIVLDAIMPKTTKDTSLRHEAGNAGNVIREIPKGTTLNYIEQKTVNKEVWSLVETEDGIKGWVHDEHLAADWLLLDEINLADPAILERFNPLFDDDKFVVLTEKQNEVVKAHPSARLFATMNPSSYSGRKELSEAMMNRLHVIYVQPYAPEELVQIIQGKSSLDPKVLLQMVMAHRAVSDMALHRQIGKRDGPYPYSIRDLLKWTSRVEKLKDKVKLPVDQLICREFLEIYQKRLQNPQDKKVVEDTLRINFKGTIPPSPVPTVEVKNGILQAGDIAVPVNPGRSWLVPGDECKLVHINSTSRHLYELTKGILVDEPMLLVGNTGVGKTAMVRYIAKLTNRNFRRFNLEHHTDVSEFIGGYIPKPGGKPGEYIWKDGILLEAMKPKAVVETSLYLSLDSAGSGKDAKKAKIGESFRWLEQKEQNGVLWSKVSDSNEHEYWVKDKDIVADIIVFDEINLAQPAILERMNSLLDPDRSITLTEKDNEIVLAHPSFRVFGTMNPCNSKYAGRKELSLAMRNRFTEVWVEDLNDRGELTEIVTYFLRKLPDDKLAIEKIERKGMAEKMIDFHQALIAKAEKREVGKNMREGLKFTVRNLQYWSRYIREFYKERTNAGAFYEGALHCYTDQFYDENDKKAVNELLKTYLPAPLPEDDKKPATPQKGS